MTDITTAYLEFRQKQSAIRDEITRCQDVIDRGKPHATTVAVAEKNALEAELRFLWAEFDLTVEYKGLNDAYIEFGHRPKVPKGEDWSSYIVRESSDYEDYLAWHQQILDVRYPAGVSLNVQSKLRKAKEAEEAWVRKIEIWEREYRTYLGQTP